MDVNGEIIYSENKKKLAVIDHALLAHHYDLRMSVSTETKASLGKQPMNLTNERHKTRTSYKLTSPDQKDWKVDLTEVISHKLNPQTGNQLSVQKEIELEIELENVSMLNWLNIQDSSIAVSETKRLSDQLLKLLEYLIAAENDILIHQSITQIDPIPEYSIKQIFSLNNILRNGNETIKKSKSVLSYLGSTPLNLNRQSFAHLKSIKYYYTEKSDGLRNLLYVIPDRNNRPIGVLMSRAKESRLFSLPGDFIIGEAFGLNTILDGELVYNRSFHRDVFLVFDVLMTEGQQLISKPFSERLAVLNKTIKSQCDKIPLLHQQYKKTSNQSHLPIPIDIIRKTYYTNLSELTSRIHCHDFDYVYYDTDRRHHKIDGIIFQPDLPYTFGNDPYLLKWKYSELRSVDLSTIYSFNDDRITLYASGPENTQIEISKSYNIFSVFEKFERYRFLADIHDGNLTSRKPIVEVVYDTRSGYWRYLKLRKDKDEPNYIDTVIGVILEQSEDISIEELEAALLPSQITSLIEISDMFDQEWVVCKRSVLSKIK